MNIINRRTIIAYSEQYPVARNQLLAWYNEFRKHEFSSFHQLKEMYGNASIINNQWVVFNIKGNDYRLVTAINFHRKACYTIWFGTHKEYDKIDVATIPFKP